MKRKLKNHKYANCSILINDEKNCIMFISYTTTVIIAQKLEDGWYLMCTGTYSATTRKQIGWFLKEYFPKVTYYNMKESAKDGTVYGAVELARNIL